LNQQTPTSQDNSQNFINPFGNNGDTQNFNNLEANSNGLNQDASSLEQQLPSQNFNQVASADATLQEQNQGQPQPNQFGDQLILEETKSILRLI